MYFLKSVPVYLRIILKKISNATKIRLRKVCTFETFTEHPEVVIYKYEIKLIY